VAHYGVTFMFIFTFMVYKITVFFRLPLITEDIWRHNRVYMGMCHLKIKN